MMTHRILSISSVAVIVLGLIDLSLSQHFAPFPWSVQYFDRAQVNPQTAAPPPPLNPARSEYLGDPLPPKYLDSFIPAVMQLLHYFSERMQYAELHSTTVAPPYTGGSYDVPGQGNTTPLPTTTWTTTTTTTTTTPTPQVQPESTTSMHRPGLFAPLPPQFQIQLDAQVPHDTVHATTKKPAVSSRPTVTRVTTKRTTTKPRRPLGTTRKPVTTRKPAPPRKPPTTTTKKPWSQTTTRKPYTTKPKPPPPRESHPEYTTTKRPAIPQTLAESNGFFSWFFENAPNPKQHKEHFDTEDLYDILDPLPKELLNDIESEGAALPALKDEDNVREFLKKYDDSFGRFVPSQTGAKIKPPTKPFVEFLVLYDQFKREAKDKMYNEYQGYSDNVLSTLHATSYMSSERQMHYVMSQVYSSTEITSMSIRTRMETIIKDLENPYSVTSKTLREIPAFIFAL